MHCTNRPSPRVTLPQKFFKSAAQAPSTVSTAAASRSLMLGWADGLGLDWADALECASPAATHAAAASMILRLFPIFRSPFLTVEVSTAAILLRMGSATSLAFRRNLF